tara:strand:- start:141 stop:503 length:363 start_codon:yes stop_codon:yes gene_type:complete
MLDLVQVSDFTQLKVLTLLHSGDNTMNPASGNWPYAPPSGELQYPYNVIALLREERDDLIKLRKEEKNKIKICEREEARWKQNRMQYRNSLKNINIDIIESNEKIKAELDKIDDLTEEDV